MPNWTANLEAIKKSVNSKTTLGKSSESDLFFTPWRISVTPKYGRRTVPTKKESTRPVSSMLWRGFLITFKGFLTTAMIMIVLPTNATEAKTSEIAPFTSKTVAWNPMAKWFCLTETFSAFQASKCFFESSEAMFITKMASAVSYDSFKKQYLVKIWIYYVYLNKILIAKVFEIFSSVSETYSRSNEKLLDTQNPVVCIPETSIN